MEETNGGLSKARGTGVKERKRDERGDKTQIEPKSRGRRRRRRKRSRAGRKTYPRAVDSTVSC